jgi:hypothetical protein
MIKDEKYKEVLDNGLLLDHYFLLCNVRDGVKLTDNKRIQGFVNLLTKKGYIQDDRITTKGLELIAGQESGEVNLPATLRKKTEELVDFASWVQGLHVRLQDKLAQKTGYRQVRDKINGKPYSFLPNSTDLGKVLHKTMATYKLKDRDKIEKALMDHIENCARNASWFPIMGYYIMKNGTSKMVDDIEGGGEIENVKVSQELRDPKNLF